MTNDIQEKLVYIKLSVKKPEAYSEPSQTSKMVLFAEIVNDFQPLTIFTKSFFHLRSLTGFWIHMWWLHHTPFLQKTYIPSSYTSYLYHYSIDFRINMAGNKFKWMQKLHNFLLHFLLHFFLHWVFFMSVHFTWKFFVFLHEVLIASEVPYVIY